MKNEKIKHNHLENDDMVIIQIGQDYLLRKIYIESSTIYLVSLIEGIPIKTISTEIIIGKVDSITLYY